MAHMNHWKNTKKEKHKENCSHRSSTENLKAFRVIHRLRFQGQCFWGLLFSASDRGQRDTKQVVGNLIRLWNITSGVTCFREIRATLTIWNCFKSGSGASVQQRKQNSILTTLSRNIQKNSFMTYHAIDFDRYPILRYHAVIFSFRRNDVFSLMKFYFTPQWTWNESKKNWFLFLWVIVCHVCDKFLLMGDKKESGIAKNCGNSIRNEKLVARRFLK